MPKSDYKLAFGDERAVTYRSEVEFLNSLQRSGRPFSDAAFRRTTDPISKVSAVRIGGLVTFCTAGSGMRVSTRSVDELSIVLPIEGGGSLIQGKRTHVVRPRGQVIRVSYLSPITANYCGYSSTTIHPDRALLAAELALLRPDLEDIETILAETGTIVSDGPIEGIDYHNIIRSLFSMVDSVFCDQRQLERIGLESLFTRVFAEVVLAQLGHKVHGGTGNRTTGHASLDAICDHIAANTGTPLTIPQMEKLSGLSAQSLTYAFRSRFNCTPQQWQRNHLLDEARRRLSRKGRDVSVASIAADLGFSSFKRFGHYYKERFGTSPGE